MGLPSVLMTADDVEAGRYRLFVSLACPFSARALMARSLLGLEEVVPVTVVDPTLQAEGWAFGGLGEPDPVLGARLLRELYLYDDPAFMGRVTVPVLWDHRHDRLVSQESADIVRAFDTVFMQGRDVPIDLAPADIVGEIDALNTWLHRDLCVAVYTAGFAEDQTVYDEAVQTIFGVLDELEDRLDGPFLFGERLTESDLFLFSTLIRFDMAYYVLFKVNRRQIRDYPSLWAFVQRVARVRGVAETVSLDHIGRSYYSIRILNPRGVRPVGPDHVMSLFS